MKKFAVILALLLLAVGAYAVVDFKTQDYKTRGGPSRITHYDPRINWGGQIESGRLNSIAYLEPYHFDKGKGVGRGGYAPIYPRGSCKLQSSAYYGFPKGYVTCSIKDVPPTSEVNGVYEVWLVDEDSGYRLSLGAMIALGGGVGQIQQMTTNYFNTYDTVEITLEPMDDEDPTPGPIVLIGTIPRSHTFYNPEPKQGMLLTEYLEEY